MQKKKIKNFNFFQTFIYCLIYYISFQNSSVAFMSYKEIFKNFLLRRNTIEKFLFYFVFLVSNHFFVYQDWKYLILAILGISPILLNAGILKYLKKISQKTQNIIRDCNTFLIALFAIYIMQDLKFDIKNENSDSFLNVLEIIVSLIIFIQII